MKARANLIGKIRRLLVMGLALSSLILTACSQDGGLKFDWEKSKELARLDLLKKQKKNGLEEKNAKDPVTPSVPPQMPPAPMNADSQPQAPQSEGEQKFQGERPRQPLNPEATVSPEPPVEVGGKAKETPPQGEAPKAELVASATPPKANDPLVVASEKAKEEPAGEAKNAVEPVGNGKAELPPERLEVDPPAIEPGSTAIEKTAPPVDGPDLEPVALRTQAVHLARLRQENYSIELIKSSLMSLREQDRKSNETIEVAGKNIQLTNESEKLTQALKTLLGIGQEGSLNNSAKSLIEKSSIENCADVLCVLQMLIPANQSPKVVFREQGRTPEDAAAQLVFMTLYHGYHLAFYVPRLDQFSDADYQINLQRFEVMHADQIDTYAQTLWKLPPHFDELNEGVFVFMDNGQRNIGTVSRVSGKGVPTLEKGSVAKFDFLKRQSSWSSKIVNYFKSNEDEKKSSYFRFIVFNNAWWGQYENDMTFNFAIAGVTTLNAQELLVFEPDIRKRLLRNYMEYLIYNLAQVLNSSLDAEKPRNLSEQKEWQELSGWIKSANILTSGKIKNYSNFGIKFNDHVKLETDWKVRDGSKFINAFAETSPTADLAVHVAGMVLYPEKTRELVPQKANFISEKILSFQDTKTGQLIKFNYVQEKLSSDAYASEKEMLENRMFKKVEGKCQGYDFKAKVWKILNLEHAHYCENLK